MDTEIDMDIYREFNIDLKITINHDIERKLSEHYKVFGRKENRICNMDTLLKNHIHFRYFNVDDYKEYNTDLNFTSDKRYVVDYLQNQLNSGRKISKKMEEFKEAKRKLFYNKLTDVVDNYNYLDEKCKKDYVIDISEPKAGPEWDMDSDIQKIINKKKIILNVGAGYRLDVDRYYALPNVINTDAFSYPTTDVICEGHKLPFKDNSFDAVLSIDNLGHVKNPWIHAEEMMRVLKPGGLVYADIPFLQPNRESPCRYYNMTTAGVRSLFSPLKQIKHHIPPWSTPIHSLVSFLEKYKEILNDTASRDNFGKLTIDEILANGRNPNVEYVTHMDKSKEEAISYGSSFIGKKSRFVEVIVEDTETTLS